MVIGVTVIVVRWGNDRGHNKRRAGSLLSISKLPSYLVKYQMVTSKCSGTTMSKMQNCGKLLIIKSFKGFPEIQQICKIQMNILVAGIEDILNSKQPAVTFQELYNIVENLENTHRFILYEKLEFVLTELVTMKLDILLQNFHQLLILIDEIWIEYCQQCRIIRNIYLKCDGSSKTNSSFQLSMNLFKTIIVSHPKVKSGITFYILQYIYMHRRLDVDHENLLKSIISMLNDLHMYADVFQVEFLKESQNFFLDEGNQLINMIDIRAYMKHIRARIRTEEIRAKNYLQQCSTVALLEIIVHTLIKSHLEEILNKSFKLLARNKLDKDLLLLYNLLKKVPAGFKLLSEYFTDYILTKGDAIVRKTDNEKTMVQELVDFKDKLDNIVENYFSGNQNFYEVIRNTFVKFINFKQSKPAQLLAKYIDVKLRAKDLSEEELEIILNKSIVLFRYIQGKDIFEAFYKKNLAKRLLLGKSTSQDAEDSMIGKLKAECGATFTSKIEGMFKDITISQSINNSFKQYLSHNMVHNSFDLCINVLTSSFWPNYPNYDVNLPVVLTNYQHMFQKFYLGNHSGRKLVWQPHLGHCIVKATFDSSHKELVVSLFQAIILLLFNDYNEFSFSEIQEMTHIEREELKRTLISLTNKKTRILLRRSKGIEMEDGETFTFNGSFTDKLFRVKINQIQLKETTEEQTATEKSVLTDRQFQIDAAIVRILKRKKKLHHSELISELFSTLDIPVKPYDLKKRVELLIEREYLERDKDDPTYYVYIA